MFYFSYSEQTFHWWLQFLFSRFIVNCPQEELQSFERVCFQIEQAHWYYDDNYRDKDPTLPEFTLKQFAEQCTHTSK